MTFLNKIDTVYEDRKEKFHIPDNNTVFCCHFPVTIKDQEGQFSFEYEIRKSKKAKMLLIDGKQRLYLTDYDIIKTILGMEDQDVQWFLQQFISLYQSRGSMLTMIIESEEFVQQGIAIYPQNKYLLLFTDSRISFSYFSGFLSFIFFKDQCWEEQSNKSNFSKKTLYKYIALIDYYHNHSDRSKQFLDTIGYKTTEHFPAVFDRIVSKEMEVFDNMENIDLFDISKYM